MALWTKDGNLSVKPRHDEIGKRRLFLSKVGVFTTAQEDQYR
jgi:hypothetical protein